MPLKSTIDNYKDYMGISPKAADFDEYWKESVEDMNKTDFKYELDDKYYWTDREPKIETDKIIGIETHFEGLSQIIIDGIPGTQYEIKFQNSETIYKYIINNSGRIKISADNNNLIKGIRALTPEAHFTINYIGLATQETKNYQLWGSGVSNE